MTHWLFLVYLFFCERKAVPVQWRCDVKLLSCDCLWHSYRSFIPAKFDLKINQSQEYSEVALWSRLSAPVDATSFPGSLFSPSFFLPLQEREEERPWERGCCWCFLQICFFNANNSSDFCAIANRTVLLHTGEHSNMAPRCSTTVCKPLYSPH